MGAFENFPYTNFHELNLDWILKQIKELRGNLTDFVKLNTIKYGDPINWDITESYETNTVIIDKQTGNAYISTRPVPAGVSIDNTEYWTEIFNYVVDTDKTRAGIAGVNNQNSPTAAISMKASTLFWYAGKLYEALKDITTGDAFSVGNNCRLITIETLLNEEATTRKNADSKLQTNIDGVQTNLNNVSGTLQSKDEELQRNIDGVQTNLNNVSGTLQSKDEELQRNIDGVQTNLNNVSGTLQSKDEELQRNIDGVQTNLNNVSGTIQLDISNIYNKYQKTKVVVIGDSFCGDWYAFEKKSWAHRLKTLLNSTDFNIYSYGGAGYVGKDNVNGKTYQQNFDDYIKPAYSNTKDSVTLVILSGGVNDTGYNPSYSDEYTAAINLIKDVKSFFTNAKIVGLNNVSLNKISRNVVCGINWAFDFMGVPNTTFGMSWLLGKTDYFLEDNLHPNDNGQEFIANKFYSFLLTGNDSVADRYNFISDGVAGGLIWSIENYTLTIFASGSLTKALSGNSFTFPSKLPSSIAPSHTISIPVYSDAGVGTCLYITNDGTVQLIQLGTTSLPYGFGSYRVDVMLNLNDK